MPFCLRFPDGTCHQLREGVNIIGNRYWSSRSDEGHSVNVISLRYEERVISSKHALIYVDESNKPSSCFLCDLNSSQGTFVARGVDGDDFVRVGNQKVNLEDRKEQSLRLGDIECMFYWSGGPGVVLGKSSDEESTQEQSGTGVKADLSAASPLCLSKLARFDPQDTPTVPPFTMETQGPASNTSATLIDESDGWLTTSRAPISLFGRSFVHRETAETAPVLELELELGQNLESKSVEELTAKRETQKKETELEVEAVEVEAKERDKGAESGLGEADDELSVHTAVSADGIDVRLGDIPSSKVDAIIFSGDSTTPAVSPTRLGCADAEPLGAVSQSFSSPVRALVGFRQSDRVIESLEMPLSSLSVQVPAGFVVSAAKVASRVSSPGDSLFTDSPLDAAAAITETAIPSNIKKRKYTTASSLVKSVPVSLTSGDMFKTQKRSRIQAEPSELKVTVRTATKTVPKAKPEAKPKAGAKPKPESKAIMQAKKAKAKETIGGKNDCKGFDATASLSSSAAKTFSPLTSAVSTGSSSSSTMNGAKKEAGDTSAAPKGNAIRIIFSKVADMENLVKAIPKAQCVEDPRDATHLITSDQLKRTPKLMIAINSGVKYVLSTKWLELSSKAQSPLATESYIIRDKEKERLWDFSMDQTLSSTTRGGVFKHVLFFITKGICGRSAPEAEEMRDIIESGGGKVLIGEERMVLTKIPTAEELRANCSPSKGKKQFIVIATEDTRSQIPQRALDLMRHNLEHSNELGSAVAYTAEFIFRAVMRQSLLELQSCALLPLPAASTAAAGVKAEEVPVGGKKRKQR